MGKKTIYATEEKLAQLNPQNIDIMNRFFASKMLNLSDTTVASYRSDLNQWFVFIMERYQNKYILDFTTEEAADMLEDFIAFCISTLQNNERRIQRRISTISSFYIFLRKKRRITESPCEFLERPKIKVGEKPQIKQNYLTKEQINQIRDELERTNQLQLLCLFEYALSTMLRVNAVVNTRIDQIDFENKIVSDIKEKEGYIVKAFPSERSFEIIEKWLDYRKRNGIEGEYLFINMSKDNSGKQISKSTVQSVWIKRIGEIIGVPSLHMHDLRHSMSSLYYADKMSLENISSLLNHQNTSTTLSHYIQRNFQDIQNEKTKFDI